MLRLMLTDADWERLVPELGKLGVYRTRNLRMRFEAILWRERIGSPWRDLPTEFGPWSTIYNLYNRWAERGILSSLMRLLQSEIDPEWSFMDGTYVRAHQDAAGAAGKADEGIGVSRGGRTTKIHMLADAHGNPVHFEITGGQVHDISQAEQLLAYCPAETALINDKGYDSDALRERARGSEITPIIPRRRNSAKPNPEFDRELYKLRHLVENLFARLKRFRAVATRYDKLKRNFVATVSLACAMLWLRL